MTAFRNARIIHAWVALCDSFTGKVLPSIQSWMGAPISCPTEQL
jgi:hypothetical protein